MSLEDTIADLVTATTELTEAVNVKKVTLDDAVADADAAKTEAQTAAGLAVEAQTDIHNNWQGKLDIAAQQAETATIQAGIATDKAAEASGSAATANAAKTAAELARDAAMVGAVTYPDEATGRAAVADGEYFKVIGSGDVAAREYRRTDASTSVLVAEYPSVGAIENIWSASEDLFLINEYNLFQDANLIVRRYLTDGQITDYPQGYSQTSTPTGLRVAIPQAGSSAIRHYLRTGRVFGAGWKIIQEVTISEIIASTAVGIGYIAENGDYVMYSYSATGNFGKTINQTNINLSTGNTTYTAGAVLRFEIENSEIKIYLNNALVVSGQLDESEFKTELLVGQSGFSVYEVNQRYFIDPIRTFVKDEIDLAGGNITMTEPAYYSYDSINEIFTAYTQVKNNLFVGFAVMHQVDLRDLQFQDYWRIISAEFYNFNGDEMVPTGKMALSGGESEFVFKQSALKDDFTGGYHGDEIVTDIKFLADGIPVSLVTDIPLTGANKVEYIEKSTMHETAQDGVFIPGHPVIAYHTKHTSFENRGYKTKNFVKWNYAGTLSTLYHGISCISKDVAAIVFSDDTYTDQLMTGSGSDFFNAIGARLYKGRNEANGLAVEAASYQQKVVGADELSNFFVSDRNSDSKYYRKSPARTVAVGELHESYFECSFFSI